MKYLLKIEGMSCQHCVKHVREALSAIEGVTEVMVDLGNKSADITAEQELSEVQLKSIIEDAGYELVSFVEA